MRESFEALEARLVEAINLAIEGDLVLIRNEHGVAWSGTSWSQDPHLDSVRGCDVLGALLLQQPVMNFEEHQGDAYAALRGLLDEPEDHILDGECIARNITNGWDGEDFLGGSQEAYVLGQRLAVLYRPLDVDAPDVAQSETRLVAVASLDSFADDDDFAITAA